MRPVRILVLADLVVVAACWALAFLLRLDVDVLYLYVDPMLQTMPIVMLAAAIAFPVSGLYRSLTRYPSLDTLLAVGRAVVMTILLALLGIFLARRGALVPRSIFFIAPMLMGLTMGMMRLWPRLKRYPLQMGMLTRKSSESIPVLVYGAGDAGEAAIRDMLQRGGRPYFPVGLIDDDATKVGRTLQGRPVLGTGEELAEVVEKTGAEQVLIAMPSLRGAALRRVVDRARESDVVVQTLPALTDLVDGRVTVQEFQPVRIEDLLMRAPRDLSPERVRSFLGGKTVLVTGAGGSIGSELCRQIAGCGPAELILFEQSEFNLYRIDTELQDRFPGLAVSAVLGDASHLASIEPVVRDRAPQVIFHAAAYKHVPLLERNPCEGVLNNVLGVVNTVRAADRHGVGSFVYISTDKAVRPVNVMGGAKRVGEIYVQAMAPRSETVFSAVRFGNVLGSSGSVIPRFAEQVRNGGPITVTHPEIDRYFMLTSEAVGLTLQAATLGRSGEIFVLDMGEPVRIVDLARDVARSMGVDPDEGEIEIVFTGLRPGEKLHEELVHQPGGRVAGFENITLEAFRSELSWDEIQGGVTRLVEVARAGDAAATIEMLERIVPEFELVGEKGEHLPVETA